MYRTPKKPGTEAGSWCQSTTKTPFRRSSMHLQAKTPSRRATTTRKAKKRAVEENAVVAIRMRPLNPKEKDGNITWEVDSHLDSVFHTEDGCSYTFDKAFSTDATTNDVYDGVAKNVVQGALLGLNGTIFAYGQTSSGKTYTMQGAGSRKNVLEQQQGILQLAAADIFDYIQGNPERCFSVQVSALEVYNEELRDLLSDETKTLKPLADDQGVDWIKSEKINVSTYEYFVDLLARSQKSRKTACTAMNDRSSRGHVIVRLVIESKLASEIGERRLQVSTLDLVDLAGSESVRNTGATGERQKEGGMINQSLLTLSRVIETLGSGEHVSYRASMLTRILKPSLCGDARLAVICCATPSALYADETKSTLQFGAGAKKLKTRPLLTSIMDESAVIPTLQQEIDNLRLKLVETEKELSVAKIRQNEDSLQDDYVLNLEESIIAATSELGHRERKLANLQDFMFRYGNCSKGAAQETLASGDRKRRYSTTDAYLGDHANGTEASLPGPKTESRPATKQRLIRLDEAALYREAFFVKSTKVSDIELQLRDASLSVHQTQVENTELKSAIDRLQKEKDSTEAQLQQHIESNSFIIQQNQRVVDNDLKTADKDGAISQLQKEKESLEVMLQQYTERSSFAIQQKEGEIEALRSAKQGLLSELDSQNARHKKLVAEKNLKIQILEQELNDSKLQCIALKVQANTASSVPANRFDHQSSMQNATNQSPSFPNQENEMASWSENRRKGVNLGAPGPAHSSHTHAPIAKNLSQKDSDSVVKAKVKTQKKPRIESKWTGSSVWVRCGKKEEWPAKLLYHVDDISGSTDPECRDDGFVWVRYDDSKSEALVETSRVRPMFEHISGGANEEDRETQLMELTQESQTQDGPRRSGRTRRTPQEAVVADEKRVKTEIAEAAANRPNPPEANSQESASCSGDFAKQSQAVD